MGPTTSNIKQGQSGIGFEYTYGESDITFEGYGLKETLDDIDSDLLFTRFSYSFGDGSEFFARLGIGEIEDMGNEFAWGLGTKVKLDGKDNLNLGVIAQFSGMNADDTEIFGPYLVTGEFNIYVFQIGLGPSYMLGEGCIYVGPMFQFITGDVDIDFAGIPLTLDIEQDSIFGGFLGSYMPLSDNCYLNVEYQLTPDAYAFGVNFTIRFGKSTEAKKRKSIQRIEINSSGKKIRGYKATIDPLTGKPVIYPVYEDEQKK